jgi:hypothetical protein
MADLFTLKYHLLWTVALALALFLPVRQLIWVLSVRRHQAKAAQAGEEVGEEMRRTLKRRAGFTSALLCFVFAFFYTQHILGPAP